MRMKNKTKVLKPTRLIFLIVLIASNTFAWFVYSTKIDSSVSVHIKAWDIVFENDENEITQMININVDSIYPGMEDYEYEITAYNFSEVSAILSYKVLSASILGTNYISQEGRAELGQEVQQGDLTSLQLEQKLLNDYPFTISISTSSNTIDLGNGEETYTLSVEWPFESNQDDVDTLWGVNANQYKTSNPSSPSITLSIKIIISQNPN